MPSASQEAQRADLERPPRHAAYPTWLTPLAASRLRKFVSYYRPHIPLLLADVACAVIVALTALSLPLCANIVTRRLAAQGAAPPDLGEIYAMGGVMLALLCAQAVSTLFVDYQGHVMGAKMESALRRELFE